MINLFDDFLSDLDPVEFIERKLILEGSPFSYTNNGRDFAKEIIQHCCNKMKYDKKSKPVAVLKGRQVGISTLSAAISLYFMYTEVNQAFLHAFPEVNQSKQYSKRALINLIQESIEKGGLPEGFLNVGGTQNEDHKDFHNRNTLYIKATSVDGRRLRGLTLQGIPIFDEFAQMTEPAFRTVMETASNSRWQKIDGGKTPAHLIFGTPTNEESLFHKIWKRTNKKEFFFKCPHCGNDVSLFYDLISRTEVFTNLESGTLIKCLNKFDRSGCGKLFEKVREMPKGVWKSTIPADQSYDYEGFFVPQFLRGNVTREEIDYKYKEMPLREFYNEVLGLFYTYQEEALSRADIIRLTTTNPDTSTWEFPNHYLERGTFMGIDWGGRVSGVDDKGSGSYTTVAILSLENTAGMRGQLKLVHVIRLSEKTTEAQIEKINEIMRRFGVVKCIADFGYGKTQKEMLEKTHGVNRFLACTWSGNARKAFSFNKKENLLTANKNTAHEYFFGDLRQGKFCFPFSQKSEEQIEWLLDHMTNIEVSNVERNGIITKEFHKKLNCETDGLAALIYAWTAYEFFKTNGFTMGPGERITSGRKSSLGFSVKAPALFAGSNNLRGGQPRLVDKHTRGRR